MRKKCLLLFAAVIFIIGCGKNTAPIVQDSQTKGLIVEVDQDDIEEVAKAKVYTSELWRWDETAMLDTFMPGEETEREVHALGNTHIYEDEEKSSILLLYDGGEEWGLSEEEGAGAYGGFDFQEEPKGMRINLRQFSMIMGMERRGEKKNEDYPSAEEKDLPFGTYQTVKTEMNELLHDITDLDFEVVISHTILPEIAQKKLESLSEEEKNGIMDHDTTWSENDGAYYMLYNQMIDDIPIVDELWTEGIRKAGEAPYTYVSILKSGNGVFEIQARNLHVLKDEGEEKELISYEQALEAVKKKYEYVTSKTVLKDARFCYIAEQTDTRFQYQLLPTWMFLVEQELRDVDYGNQKITQLVDSYIGVSAVTGEILGVER